MGKTPNIQPVRSKLVLSVLPRLLSWMLKWFLEKKTTFIYAAIVDLWWLNSFIYNLEDEYIDLILAEFQSQIETCHHFAC